MNEGSILVVDDDREIVRSIAIHLEKEGYSVLCAYNGLEALDMVMSQPVCLIIIDVMMPKMDGLSAIMKIREKRNLPIIVLSAKSEDTDKILGLSMGADDYVTKPFSPSELVARVDAVYRRVALEQMRNENNFREEIRSGEFVLNLRNRSLMKAGKPIELTQVEFQLMEYFFCNPTTALDRGAILKHVWGDAYYGEEKIVDVNIRRLRMKVEDEPSNPKHIITVWGLGYKWEA